MGEEEGDNEVLLERGFFGLFTWAKQKESTHGDDFLAKFTTSKIYWCEM